MNDFSDMWLCFVEISPEDGKTMTDLIDLEDSHTKSKQLAFTGAWANILVRSKTINEALEILPLGLRELSFNVVFVDKVANIGSLIENSELSEDIFTEAEWLKDSSFVFKIAGNLYPYSS